MAGYAREDLLDGVDEIPEEQRYTGPTTFLNGWHYTVVDDTASKQRAVAIAQVDLDHAKAQNASDMQIANLEYNLRIVQLASHERPDQKLYSDGRGNYRLATDGDKSHSELFHRNFATVEMTDGAPALRLTPEDAQAVRDFLAQREIANREGGPQ